MFIYGATHNDFVDHANWLTERTGGIGGVLSRTVELATRGRSCARFWTGAFAAGVSIAFPGPRAHAALAISAAPYLHCVKSLASDNFFPLDTFTSPPLMTTDTG